MSGAVQHIVAMGVSGCGKSTTGQALADHFGWPFIEGDAFHPAANVAKMRAGTPLGDDDRAPWLRALADEIARNEALGQSSIMGCSALKRAYRDAIIGDRPDVALVYLRGSRELIGRRMASRQHHFMPTALLDSQFATLEEPQADETALVVSVEASQDTITRDVVERLGLGQSAVGSGQ